MNTDSKRTISRILSCLDKYSELIFSAALMAVWILFYIQTDQIRQLSSGSDGLGPAFVPRIVLLCMMGLTAILTISAVIQIYRARGKQEEEPSSETQTNVTKTFRGFISIASIFVYLLLMQPLGFIISSWLYLFSQMIFIGGKGQSRPARYALISIAVVIIVFFFFRRVTYIMLPTGILPFIA